MNETKDRFGGRNDHGGGGGGVIFQVSQGGACSRTL